MKHARGVILIIAFSAILLAQQINTQINPELYGHGATNSVKYSNVPSSFALPSEVRYAYWRSGATPSESRMGYSAIGPLDPGGPMAYIPPAQNYSAKPATSIPEARAPSYSASASIRYSAPSGTYTPPSYTSASPIAPSMVSQGPINAGPINTSVRYGR